MNLYVARDGETDGPFSEAEVRAYVKSGLLPKNVLVCPEGEDRWRQLWPDSKAGGATDEFGEEVFYRKGRVLVTRSRFVAGAQTYVIRNITSVEFATVPRSSLFGWILLTLGLFVGLTGLAGTEILIASIGIIMTIGGVLLILSRKPLYAVALKTSGGDLRAITDENESYIQAVVTALNKAVIAR